MTGKSELTTSLRERLAGALSVEPSDLSSGLATPASRTFSLAASVGALPASANRSVVAPSISDFLTDPAYLVATLRTLPAGDEGRRLKRALLNAVEDLALEASHPLPADYSDIRHRVLAGEL
jgi:hypothetical protein